MDVARMYATFVVGGHWLGLPVLEVQEVLRGQSLTRVALASGRVEGLMNLRGQIVVALDTRRILGLAPRPDGVSPVSIVVRADGGAVSLQADEVGEVEELDSAEFEPPPSNLNPGLRSLLRGVHKMQDRLLLVLDIQRAVESGGEV